MANAQTIYFDESGFTENNLLNLDQPAFVYAGIAIDPDDGSRLHSETISYSDDLLNYTELKPF